MAEKVNMPSQKKEKKKKRKKKLPSDFYDYNLLACTILLVSFGLIMLYSASAYEAAARLIETDATAVFASSDNIALGLLKRLYAHDLRVPRDYSVVSYDNSAADVLFEPALTSIEQNVPELSQAALDLLFRRIAESEAGELGGPDEVVLDPKLVLKDSVRRLD